MRKYLQPSATMGAVPKPKLSAPMSAALITSRPVFKSAVGLQAHAMPQFIGAQRLMGLGQPQFPGRAGVLDRGQRDSRPCRRRSR